MREMAGAEPELMAMLEPLLAVLASMIEAARPADQAGARHRQGARQPAGS